MHLRYIINSNQHSIRLSLGVYILTLVTFSVLPFMVRAEQPTEFKLDDFINEIRLKDPAIKAARFRWQAMQVKAPAAGVLPDPTLNYGYYFSNVETRVGAMNQRIAFAQEFLFPGKLTLSEKRAQEEAEIAMWQYHRVTRASITQGKIFYFELNRIDRTREILTNQIDLVKKMIQTLQSRFETNQAHLPDVLLAKQTLSDLSIQLASLNGDRGFLIALINRLRGMAPDAVVSETNTIAYPKLPDKAMLLSLAEKNNETLKAEEAAIRRDEITVKLSKKNRYPDFTVGVDYTQVNSKIFSNPFDNGQDAVFGYVSINLPIRFRRYVSYERSARSSLSATREQWEATRLDIRAEAAGVYSRAEAFFEQIDLYERTLLPQARETYQATVMGYGAGRDSALKWIESQRNLLGAETGWVFLKAELAKAVSELEKIVAVELFHPSLTTAIFMPSQNLNY